MEVKTNNSGPSEEALAQILVDDAAWMMTSAFIIFTMQTGFGLLESGVVSAKNEVNIMMKNVVDIFLGGLTYWLYGYGLSFGRSEYSTPYLAFGDFALNVANDDPSMGSVYTFFVFQLSFATTATTIVSGAMAERCGFKAYCLFSLLNRVVYCIPAGWVWGKHGFLNHMGAVDIAGSGPVHLTGGITSLAAAMMLGPRLGRYKEGQAAPALGSPLNCAMGLFLLWWGWLAFNSGSTYGVTHYKWAYAAKAAVMTMLSSFGGGTFGLLYSFYIRKGKCSIMDVINAILGSLVAITAGCFLYNTWEALLVGTIGGMLTSLSAPIFDILGIDDPVGATSVHGVSGLWGVLAVGLFGDDPVPLDTTQGRKGLFKGGGWELFLIQTEMAFFLIVWSFIITVALLWFVDKFFTLRLDPQAELIGADFAEHNIRDTLRDLLSTQLNYQASQEDELKRKLEMSINLWKYPQSNSAKSKISRTKFGTNKLQRPKLKRRKSSERSITLPPIIANGNDEYLSQTMVWLD